MSLMVHTRKKKVTTNTNVLYMHSELNALGLYLTLIQFKHLILRIVNYALVKVCRDKLFGSSFKYERCTSYVPLPE